MEKSKAFLGLAVREFGITRRGRRDPVGIVTKACLGEDIDEEVEDDMDPDCSISDVGEGVVEEELQEPDEGEVKVAGTPSGVIDMGDTSAMSSGKLSAATGSM